MKPESTKGQHVGNRQEVADLCWDKITDDGNKEKYEDAVTGMMLLAAVKALEKGVDPTSKDGLYLIIEHAWKAGFRTALKAYEAGAIQTFNPETN